MALPTDRNNTAVGFQALSANTGYYNTATGGQALAKNKGGGNNTATGTGALSTNTTGRNNTAIGQGALSTNTMLLAYTRFMRRCGNSACVNHVVEAGVQSWPKHGVIGLNPSSLHPEKLSAE